MKYYTMEKRKIPSGEAIAAFEKQYLYASEHYFAPQEQRPADQMPRF